MDQLDHARDFMSYVTASPSPRHAVGESVRRLQAGGFTAASPVNGSPAGSGDAPDDGPSDDGGWRGYAERGGSLLAWRVAGPGPVRVITAHTDSPNLRVKPRPDVTGAGTRQLGVETYGGVLLNSWLDRDLGLAGHVALRAGDQVETRLVRIDRPVLRIPQLAIHLDREISSKGLQLNKQNHMKPMWGLASDDDERGLLDLLAAEIDVEAGDILAHQLMTFDVQPPALGGWHNELLASARIDNQLSCWAAIEALLAAAGPGTQIIALFDHEEVGSTSATGADSSLLADALASLVGGPDAAQAPSPGSLCVSADCAHATHPNYADRHDPDHQIALNGGPAIKVNANERYATTPLGHALFADACERAGVPHQVFVNRSDLACGSTVGPITAARTGLDTVDIGAPQLAMHSARETTGSQDPGHLLGALTAIFGG